VLVLAVRLQAQTAAPVFDVVSLKPAVSAGPAAPPRLMGMRRSPGRIDVGSWSVKQLILRAYGLWPSQLSGPEWMDAARYDLSAKLPSGAKPEQLPEMLQHMLADRFRTQDSPRDEDDASILAPGGQDGAEDAARPG
jgi:uncharacterized protein (TIGR03435 family)